MNQEKLRNLWKGLFKKTGSGQELKEFLTLAAQSPDDMRIKLKVGELYFKTKDLAHGIEVFREVGEQYVTDGFLLKAIAIYKNILKFSPGSVEFNEKLGDLYFQLGMKPEASQQYLIAVQYHLTHGELPQAINLCQKLIEANPEDMNYRMKLAEIHFNQGQQEEALKQYEHIAKELRRDMKQLDLLVEVYEKILLKRPKEMVLLKELCVFYLKLGQVDKTLRKIEKFKLQEDPEFQPVYQKALALKEKQD